MAALKIRNGKTKIDLLLTEAVLLRGMNGRQLADAARVARPNLRVLLVSGYGKRDFEIRSYRKRHAGFDKPLSMDALPQRVSELISVGTEGYT